MGEIERGGGGGLGSGCGLMGSARVRGASVRERRQADVVMVVVAVGGGIGGCSQGGRWGESGTIVVVGVGFGKIEALCWSDLRYRRCGVYLGQSSGMRGDRCNIFVRRSGGVFWCYGMAKSNHLTRNAGK